MGVTRAAGRAFREGLRARYPPRYGEQFWRIPFDARLLPMLRPGLRILDVGAGAWPTIPRAARPERCRYVGLDVSAHELAAAEHGSYDETVVADVTQPVDALREQFDLVVCWFVIEHVESTASALSSMRGYLRPGGRLLAQTAGRHASFSVLNRLIPDALASPLLARTMGRRPESVFPARYDACTYNALTQVLQRGGWDSPQVTPLHVAALYWAFAAPLRAAFLAYEEVAYRRGWDQLASYYLIDAVRG